MNLADISKREVTQGSRLNLARFGGATVTKIYAHVNKGSGAEKVCDVVADSGERMHLSMRYAARVQAA